MLKWASVLLVACVGGALGNDTVSSVGRGCDERTRQGPGLQLQLRWSSSSHLDEFLFAAVPRGKGRWVGGHGLHGFPARPQNLQA